MACKCAGHQSEFSSETCIHFSGLKNLDKPGVFLYPKLLVCLDCGSTSFTVPQTQLSLLWEGCGEERGAGGSLDRTATRQSAADKLITPANRFHSSE